jgi:signal transduction histidine kinase
MKRSHAIALLMLVACTLGAGWASVLLGLRAHALLLRDRATHEVSRTRTAYDRDARAIALQLQQACARDAQVDRLALELGAGGQAEGQAAATAKGLSRAFHAPVWLLLERSRGSSKAEPADAAISMIAWADEARSGAATPPPTAPEALPSPMTLRAASTGPVLWSEHESARALAHGSEPLIASCARALGRDTLWVVRAEPLAQAQARFMPASESVSEAAPRTPAGGMAERMKAREPDQSDRLTLHALSIPTGRAQAPREIWLRIDGLSPLPQLVALAPLLVALVAAVGALAYLLLTRRSVGDEVLIELEQAAERVAKGDLTARIGLRPGGRADQTFRTFDRMTAELSDMRGRLADAERAAAWQDIARRIAHEIKNPLSPIRIAIETLRKAHDKQLPAFEEIFDESTRAILEEVRRMEHIVSEFSEFARLPRARPGALDLAALIADTVALYQPDDVPVELAGEVGDATARADREQIVQVLVNLLQNAADAARSAEQPRVRVTLELGERALRVHVDDNGAGIASGDRERVFEPYYTTKEHGTGLGLAIVKRIAADHEGSVAVSDSPLGGARFTLELPRTA